jgi:hypothetical protein
MLVMGRLGCPPLQSAGQKIQKLEERNLAVVDARAC